LALVTFESAPMDEMPATRAPERFFCDAHPGHEILGPPLVSLACANLRIALGALGYEPSSGFQYDETLREQVKQFQQKYGHPLADGRVGPNTRRRLVDVLLEAIGDSLWERLRDPEEWRELVPYFQDPDAGASRLQPNTFGPFTYGPACANVRFALSLLGFDLGPGDRYDDELRRAVRQFQVFNKHTNQDGVLGRATRRLLALRLLEVYGSAKVRGLVDPADPPPLQKPFGACDLAGGPFLSASYAHRDSFLVFPELARIQAAGTRVWYDEGIEPGAIWAKTIEAAIEGCSWFVLFLSSRAVASDYVHHEIKLALTRPGRPFIAVHMRPVHLPPSLAPTIDHLQAILAYQMGQQEYERKLAQGLR
jgi:peptidoglycan hydrolase-like protein with peptidoglycan-binding domain